MLEKLIERGMHHAKILSANIGVPLLYGWAGIQGSEALPNGIGYGGGFPLLATIMTVSIAGALHIHAYIRYSSVVDFCKRNGFIGAASEDRMFRILTEVYAAESGQMDRCKKTVPYYRKMLNDYNKRRGI